MWPHTDQFQSIWSQANLANTILSISAPYSCCSWRCHLFPREFPGLISSALLKFDHTHTHTHTHKRGKHTGIYQVTRNKRQDCGFDSNANSHNHRRESSPSANETVQRNFFGYVTRPGQLKSLTEKLCLVWNLLRLSSEMMWIFMSREEWDTVISKIWIS